MSDSSPTRGRHPGPPAVGQTDDRAASPSARKRPEPRESYPLPAPAARVEGNGPGPCVVPGSGAALPPGEAERRRNRLHRDGRARADPFGGAVLGPFPPLVTPGALQGRTAAVLNRPGRARCGCPGQAPAVGGAGRELSMTTTSPPTHRRIPRAFGDGSTRRAGRRAQESARGREQELSPLRFPAARAGRRRVRG